MVEFDPKIEPVVSVPQAEQLTTQKSPEAQETHVAEEPARLKISDQAKDYSKAVQQLEEAEEPRADVIANAKQKIAEWQDLTDDQIDVITNKLVDEL